MLPDVEMVSGRKTRSRSAAAYAGGLTVLPHFDFGSVVEQHVGVSIAQLSVAAPGKPTIAREIVLT